MNHIRCFGLYSGYRTFCWPWWRHYLDPRTYWCAWETFCQRGLRGWADRDVWSVDMYLSEVITEMLEHYLETSHHLFYEDDSDDAFEDFWTKEEKRQQRDALQKRSDVKRVIAAFKADADECTVMMCDHETDFEKKKIHAEYWMDERKWAFTWLHEHWNGLWN